MPIMKITVIPGMIITDGDMKEGAGINVMFVTPIVTIEMTMAGKDMLASRRIFTTGLIAMIVTGGNDRPYSFGILLCGDILFSCNSII